MAPPDGAVDVLVVSTWFPSVEDGAAGRFVADQVEALAESGRVRPTVVSFEPLALTGSSRFRDRQAATLGDRMGAAIRSGSDVLLPEGVGGPAGIPIARLPVAAAPTRAVGAAHASIHRAAALDALWDASGARGLGHLGLIHAHTGYPDGAAAAHLSKRIGCPLIVTEHSSTVARHLSNPAQREWYLRAIAQASRFVAVSETLASELREALPEYAAKIVVIPNAVPIEDFAIGAPEARVADRLLFVGYLKETKGLANLLDAFARVHAARPSATLVVAGRAPTPELQRRWEARVERLGAAGAVTFTGALDRAGVAAAMTAASLFVHPSPRETFGVVAVEALAAGLPVVATDSGGVTEVLGSDPSRHGAIVPPEDADALAGAILATLDRIDEFRPEDLRESVAARFGSRPVAARLVELYREVLASEIAAAPSAPGEGRVHGASTGSRQERRPAPRPGLPRAVVLAGFDRDRVAQVLDRLPPELRRRIGVATIVGPQQLSADVASVSFVQLDDRYTRDLEVLRALGHGGGQRARLTRFLRHPGAVIRRRISGRGESVLLRSMTAAITEQAEAMSRLPHGELPEVGHQPLVVVVDGLAVLAASPLIGSGRVRLAPGGPRWLADLWQAGVDASDRPGATS